MNDATRPSGARDLSALRIERPPPGTPGPSAAPRRGPLGAFAILAALVVGAAAGYFARGGSEAGGGATTAVATAPAGAPRVRTAVVATASGAAREALLTASGYVVAQRAAAVSSKATGRLVELAVEEGDRVVAGQIIGRVESEDVEAALAQARAELEVARAARTTAAARAREADLAVARTRKLHAERLVSQAALDEAEAAHGVALAGVASADAAIAAAQAGVEAQEVALENTRVRAPFDGTVLTKTADVGEMVAPFGASATARAAIVTLADMTSLEVEADVSESNIHGLALGAPVEVVLDAYPTHRYPGKIKKIVPTADRAKATVLTKVALDEVDERVLPEMSAKITFFAPPPSAEGAAADALQVPAAAVFEEDGKAYVWQVVDGRVRRIGVVVGPAAGRTRTVSAGLRAGDRVVVDAPAGLAEGTAVAAS